MRDKPTKRKQRPQRRRAPARAAPPEPRERRASVAPAGQRKSENSDTAASELSNEQLRRILAGELAPGDVAALRRLAMLSQAEFAAALGISRRTLQNWEQARCTPDGPGLALLRIVARHPRVIRENISGAT